MALLLGTLAQTVADYPLNLYFRAESGAGLYVNLYTPSRLRTTFAGKPLELTQETRYPAEDTVALTLKPAVPLTTTIYLRIPGWLTQPATIQINGKPAEAAAPPGTYAALRRTWRAGDRIDLTLPQDFRTESIDDQHPNTVALMRGPVQYVALNPPPSLTNDRLPLPASLKQSSPQSFVENYQGAQLIFVPLHTIQNQTYTSYFTKA